MQKNVIVVFKGPRICAKSSRLVAVASYQTDGQQSDVSRRKKGSESVVPKMSDYSLKPPICCGVWSFCDSQNLAFAHLIIATNHFALFFSPLLIEKLTFSMHCVN